MRCVIGGEFGYGCMRMAKLKFCSSLLAAVVFVMLFGYTVHAQQDITPPALLDVTFEPEVIDTSKGPVTVTVTVHVTDDLSGVDSVALFFQKPSTTQKAQVEFRDEGNWSDVVEGDWLDGRHVATMVLPQYSAFGTWELYYFMLMDNVGNRADIWKPENKEDAERGTAEWPTLYNGFVFAVGEADAPQQPARKLFIPAITAN